MIYTIHRLDNRFSYRDFFSHYIGFSSSMYNRQGPLHFNNAISWFTDTYGWSAEVRQYEKMMQWVASSNMINQQPFANRRATGIFAEPPNHCNKHWSWSNHYTDLRIYVASDQELGFFKLANDRAS